MIRRALLLLLITIFLLGGEKVSAKTITVGDFSLTTNEPLFSVTNAAPGQEFASPFSIKNTGSDVQDIQISLNITADQNSLADFLFLKINKVNSGNRSCIYGCAGDQGLSAFKNSEITFNSIGPGEEKDYELVLLFSPEAGNELQNTRVVFDVTLGYRGAVPNDNPPHDDHHGGRKNTRHNIGRPNGPLIGPRGNVIGSAISVQESEKQSRVAGESTPEEGLTEGVSVTACHGWPEWAWALILVAYIFILFLNFKKCYKQEKITWKYSLFWMLVVLLLWYLFDQCRSFFWFVQSIVVSTIVGQFIYLELWRKKMRSSFVALEKEGNKKE